MKDMLAITDNNIKRMALSKIIVTEFIPKH